MSLRGGIDLGGTKIQAVVVDDAFEVLGQSRVPTPTAGGPKTIADEMAEAIREAAQLAGAETSDLEMVGVGSPGEINPKTGAVTSARNLSEWEGTFPLAARLEKALGTQVAVGNDVNVATNAEARLGAGKDFDSMLGVFWGTGVGGGIILDGKLWEGLGGAAEIGHVVVKSDGHRCPCGRRGCMEAYAGRGALEARARKMHDKGAKTDLLEIMKKKGRPRMTSGVWEDALERDDPVATELIDEAVDALGVGIASTLNILDVEAVILGGGLGVRFGDPMAKRISEAMLPHLFNDHRPPPVVVSELGDLGGAIGASLLTPAATATA